MIYIVYPLLLCVLLIGCRFYGRGKWNEDAFSLDQTKALQGFIALLIMFHHCGQKTSASWIDKRYYLGGLDFFVPIGFILVSFFTFCAGYGLYKSFKTKKNYLSSKFLTHRILPIIVLGYVVALIFFVVRLLLGERMNPKQIFWYLSGLKLANPNGWYVIVIPFFYLCFFLAFRFIKNEEKALLVVLLFTIAYQLLGASLDHNDWWIRGEWWYNSIHLFVVGIFFAMHEEGIVAHLKKHYVGYFIVSLICVFVFFWLSEFSKAAFSYYGENWGAPDKVQRRLICLLFEILVSSATVFWAFLLSMKLRIGNPFLKLMSRITLHFYLIHGLFSELFCFAFDGKLKSFYIKNSLLYVGLVFVLGLASALLLKFSEDGLRKLFKKKERSGGE
ncbi:MAG: acyltransferase [Lachnospiraceae bacterium]|nr:acyltransferase [Lachnospiraceae bacterium]